MMQITLTLSGAPGDYIDQVPTNHLWLVLLICPVLFAYHLDLLNFFLEFGLVFFGVLSICLSLVCFVSAAGCHCFDMYQIAVLLHLSTCIVEN